MNKIVFGYVPAKAMVNLYETQGYPLQEMAAACGEKGLNVDRLGLAFELKRIGMKPSTADLLAEQAKEENELSLKHYYKVHPEAKLITDEQKQSRMEYVLWVFEQVTSRSTK